MTRSPLIITMAIVAFAAGISVRNLSSSPIANAAQVKQNKLPDFNLPDIAGKPHSIREWQGKVLVINFWATWCSPCLKEIPEFVRLQTELSDQGLQFIGVALDDPEPVKAFIDSHKINYPILLGQDQGTNLAHDLGNVINTVPFTVLVDKQGNIVKSQMGTISRDSLLNDLSPLLHEK